MKRRYTNQEFAIETGIPVPPTLIQRYRLYPFDLMKKGDSFFVPGKSPWNLYGSVKCAERRTNWTFLAKPEGNGVRVWRTK